MNPKTLNADEIVIADNAGLKDVAGRYEQLQEKHKAYGGGQP